MFGCYETGEDLKGNREQRCRFVRHVQLKRSDQAFSQISLPLDTGPTLDVWIECAVRVDLTGLPLAEASSRAMPILVQANGTLYEVIQEFLPSERSCMMAVHFSGKALDLTSCKEDTTCLQRALDVYKSALRHEFSASPMGTSEIHDQPVPPGEMWMRRAYQASHILGSPYFELSTYTFKFWFTVSESGDFSLTPRKDLHSVYVNASQSFTRAVWCLWDLHGTNA
jgi:hypothetical protein